MLFPLVVQLNVLSSLWKLLHQSKNQSLVINSTIFSNNSNNNSFSFSHLLITVALTSLFVLIQRFSLNRLSHVESLLKQLLFTITNNNNNISSSSNRTSSSIFRRMQLLIQPGLITTQTFRDQWDLWRQIRLSSSSGLISLTKTNSFNFFISQVFIVFKGYYFLILANS